MVDSLMKAYHLLGRVWKRIKRAVPQIQHKTTEPTMDSVLTVNDKSFLSLFSIEQVSALLAQENRVALKFALLEYFRERKTPPWPAPPRVITDLRLNLDELGQDDLIIRADSILDCRFYQDAIPPKKDSKGNIKWCLNPASSREWLWRLNRHQWWPVLGLAYKETGDERYSAAFVNQMLDWINANPPPPHKDERSPTWRLMEVGMRMRVSWIPSFGLFLESRTFTDDAKLTMLRSIYDHANFLSLFKTSRNHLLRESNGLACVGAYFPEFKEAGYWQQVALNRLEQELVKQINKDGSHIENSTGYQWMVLDEYENTYDLLVSRKLSFPKEDLSSWLEKMYEVLAYVVRPDGTFPEINDGFMRWEYTRLAKAAEKFDRDDFRFIGTAGKEGILPDRTSVAFSDAGWYVMRSDWKKDARYLFFDAGPYGGYHGHEDKLSIEVFAFGKPFIVDSGSYTYENEDPFRSYFVSSHGHNTVLVNGKSQIRRWNKENLNPKPTSGTDAIWVRQDYFDYVEATYNDGYGSFSLEKPKNPKIIADVAHTRKILFVKPDYWVMVDKLEATNPYTYRMLFHTSPEIVVEAGPNQQVILGTTPDAASLYLIPADTRNLKVNWLIGSKNPIQGWYSVDHHHKIPSTVVFYEKEDSLSPVLTTLLYPCPARQVRDEVSIESLEVSEGKGLGFKVTSRKGVDYLMFSQGNGLKRFGPYKSNGTVAGIRTDKKGHILTQFESM